MDEFRSKLKYSIITALIVAVSLVAFYVILYKSGFVLKKERTVTSTIVANEFKQLSELTTYKYSYTDVDYFKNSTKLYGITLPLTQKSFLVKYSGYVKAGVDLENASINISNNKNNIEIKLKKSKILDNVIDINSTKILDEKSAIFNNLKSQEILDELNKNKHNIEIKLINDGFLTTSDENATKLINQILKNIGFENVKITFL